MTQSLTHTHTDMVESLPQKHFLVCGAFSRALCPIGPCICILTYQHTYTHTRSRLHLHPPPHPSGTPPCRKSTRRCASSGRRGGHVTRMWPSSPSSGHSVRSWRSWWVAGLWVVACLSICGCSHSATTYTSYCSLPTPQHSPSSASLHPSYPPGHPCSSPAAYHPLRAMSHVLHALLTVLALPPSHVAH